VLMWKSATLRFRFRSCNGRLRRDSRLGRDAAVAVDEDLRDATDRASSSSSRAAITVVVEELATAPSLPPLLSPLGAAGESEFRGVLAPEGELRSEGDDDDERRFRIPNGEPSVIDGFGE
jgi:hypothetical protein